MGIGEKLKSLRLKARRTQTEQGKVIGVSTNTVYRWECDKTRPRTAKLEKIVALYGVSADWLLNQENAPEDQMMVTFKKLSESNQYKVIGYIERLYEESLEK